MEFFVLSTVVLFVIVVYQYIINKETLLELKDLKESTKEPDILVRAKDEKGRFKGNNPDTPQNEAYVAVPVSTVRKAVENTPKKNTSRRGRKPKSTTTK